MVVDTQRQVIINRRCHSQLFQFRVGICSSGLFIDLKCQYDQIIGSSSRVPDGYQIPEWPVFCCKVRQLWPFINHDRVSDKAWVMRRLNCSNGAVKGAEIQGLPLAFGKGRGGKDVPLVKKRTEDLNFIC